MNKLLCICFTLFFVFSLLFFSCDNHLKTNKEDDVFILEKEYHSQLADYKKALKLDSSLEWIKQNIQELESK